MTHVGQAAVAQTGHTQTHRAGAEGVGGDVDLPLLAGNLPDDVDAADHHDPLGAGRADGDRDGPIGP